MITKDEDGKLVAKRTLPDRKNLETVLDVIPSAVVIIEASGKFSYLNRRALALYGMNFEDYDLDAHVARVKVLRTDETPFPPEELPISQSLKTGREIRNVEMAIHNVNGIRIPVLVSSAPLYDAKGNITAAVAIFEDLSQQKKADEAVREAEKQFRLIMENSRDGINMLDLKSGKYVFMSPAQAEMTGFTAEEINNISTQEAYERTHPDDREITINQQKKVAAGEDITEPVEYRWKVKSGEYRWFSDSRKLVRDDKGQPVAMVGITRDITERKKAEEKLQESRFWQATSLYTRNLIETSPDPLVTISAEGRITDVNKSTEEATGYPREQLIGSDFSNYFTEPEKARKGYRKVFTDGFVKDYPLTIRNKSGTTTDVLYNASVYKNEHGRIQGIFAAARDITELKKYREHLEKLVAERTIKLRESEEQFRRAIEEAPIPVIMHAEDGQVLQISHTWTELTGFEITDVPTFDAWLTKSVYGEDANQVRNQMHELFRGDRRTIDVDFSVRAKTGSTMTWSFSASSPGKLRDGRRFIVGMAVDITERIEMEAKVQEYAQSLEKLVEERTKKLRDSERLATIGATAGMVGHDIRNPLQSILADIYLLGSYLTDMPESQTKKEVSESLAGISENVEYINKIVQDLQDFARPLKPDIKEVYFEELFKQVLAKDYFPKNVEVASEIGEKAEKVMTDPAILKRILANLVNNAVQAMPRGGRLSVKTHKEPDCVVITVGDTGVGIPDDVKEKVFTPLFTTKSKGQGFGLAVVKRSTEALGGTVSFESQIGAGTVFTISLPSKES